MHHRSTLIAVNRAENDCSPFSAREGPHNRAAEDIAFDINPPSEGGRPALADRKRVPS
jgi:hypothetical protein